MRRIFQLLAFATMLAALSSCSSAIHMSIGGPGSLTAIAGAGTPRHPEFSPAESTRASGWLIVAGDSMQVLRGVPPASSRLAAPAVYRLERVSHRLSITGYTTADGRRHEWYGAVRAVHDSLEFLAPPGRGGRLERSTPAETLRVARENVRSISMEGDDPVRTAVTSTLAIGVASAFLIAAVLIGVARL